MSTKNSNESTTDPVAQAVAATREAEEQIIATLREVREQEAAVLAENAARLGPIAARRVEAERVGAELEARRAHAERVAEHQARVRTAQTTYTAAATTADEKYTRVLELRQQLAEAQAAYYPAELGRVQTGEHYKAEVRELEHLEPGLATAPAVPAKRLADHRPDATEAGLREFTLTAHPDVRSALDRLIKHEVWRGPQYAMVQGQRVQIG